MIVKLQEEDQRYATALGRERNRCALAAGYKDKAVEPGEVLQDPVRKHINGVLGEMAVAKALGMPYEGTLNTYKTGGDVGDLQVRSTPHPDGGLIVRPTDRDTDTFVLVTGGPDEFEVSGWLVGWDAMKPQWWDTMKKKDRPPCWLAPRRALHPLSELKIRLEGVPGEGEVG